MAKPKGLPFGDGVVSRPGMVSPELVDFAVCNGSDTGVRNDEPSLTRQEFSDECDINVIMAQYERTGVISHVRDRPPMYVDYTQVPNNLMDAMAVMQQADTAFMTLPAKVRKEFDNDPLKFVEFAQNPDNLDKMREFGLAPPAPQEPPTAAPVAEVAPTPDKPA